MINFSSFKIIKRNDIIKMVACPPNSLCTKCGLVEVNEVFITMIIQTTYNVTIIL